MNPAWEFPPGRTHCGTDVFIQTNTELQRHPKFSQKIPPGEGSLQLFVSLDDSSRFCYKQP